MLKKYLTILPTLTMIAAMAGGTTAMTDKAAPRAPAQFGGKPAAASSPQATDARKDAHPG